MRVLWLQSGGCGGCTQSMLCSEPRPLFDELRDAGIEFVWHPALFNTALYCCLFYLISCLFV